MKNSSPLKQTICDEISIDSLLNITDELKNEWRDNSIVNMTQKENNTHQKGRVSIRGGIHLETPNRDNRLNTMNYADQDLLNQVDEILDSESYHNTNNHLPHIKKFINKVDSHYNLQDNLQKVLNTQTTLTKTNKQIKSTSQKKVPQAEDIEDLEFQSELSDLQILIKIYRNDLKKYQSLITSKSEQSIKQKQNLKRQVSQLRDKLENSQNVRAEEEWQINNLINKNTELIYQNSELRNQIAKLKCPSSINKSSINLKRSKLQNSNNSMKKDNILEQKTQYFADAIRKQLQDMVESLVQQVQHLRNFNQKLKNQIKNLNKELTQAEKIIKKKNQKLYNLELCLINNRKQTILNPHLPVKISRLIKSHQIGQSKVKDIFHETHFQFSLADVINKKKRVSSMERLIISLKVIECYEQKINQNDFEMLMAEDLMVSMNSVQIQDIEIVNSSTKLSKHKFQRLIAQQRQDLIGKLIWNMNFILDELFRVSETNQMNIFNDMLQQNIRNKIQETLQGIKTNKLEIMGQLKLLIQSSIQSSIQSMNFN